MPMAMLTWDISFLAMEATRIDEKLIWSIILKVITMIGVCKYSSWWWEKDAQSLKPRQGFFAGLERATMDEGRIKGAARPWSTGSRRIKEQRDPFDGSHHLARTMEGDLPAALRPENLERGVVRIEF